MLTQLLVIQKIASDGKVDVHQVSSRNLHWTFEPDRKFEITDKEYFPIVIMENVNVIKRRSGSETKTLIMDDGAISFVDDYSVPDGSVITILPPKNYVPDIIKFKDIPYIPTGLVGQVVTIPPGQIQILYNKIEKQCCIILHIHHKQFFGIQCLFKKIENEDFPEQGNYWSDELFDVSISKELLQVDVIRTEDLKIFNNTINIVDLAEINDILNDILEALKTSDKSKAKNQLAKFGKIITSALGTTANVEKVIKSLSDGGGVNGLIKQILKYVNFDN
ncbi:hypothetical protein ACX0HA_04165 [Flavobacterium hauense]